MEQREENKSLSKLEGPNKNFSVICENGHKQIIEAKNMQGAIWLLLMTSHSDCPDCDGLVTVTEIETPNRQLQVGRLTRLEDCEQVFEQFMTGAITKIDLIQWLYNLDDGLQFERAVNTLRWNEIGRLIDKLQTDERRVAQRYDAMKRAKKIIEETIE